MSISATLQAKLEQLAEVDSRILRSTENLSPEQIADDPAFKLESPVADCDLRDLSIYQLHAKHKVNAELHGKLKELSAIKELHFEIDVSLENIKNAPSLSDISVLATTIERLHPTLNRLKLFDSKVLQVSNQNLAITFSLKEESNEFRRRFSSILTDILNTFVPEPSTTVFTLIGPSSADNSTISLEKFYSICRDFEVYASVSDITNKLDTIRSTWETEVLEPFLAGTSFLDLETNGPAILIHLREKSDSPVFLFEDYFKSLNDFVSFISATQIQSFKNFYSTKISNSLVDVISENIEDYMSNEVVLNQGLMHTLKHFTDSGWKMPIRNVFVSSDNIRSNLHQMYMNWTTNKYLEMLRSLFNSESFHEDLQNPIPVEQEFHIHVEVENKATFTENSAPNVPVAVEQKSEVSEELDWDQEWGSDIDDNPGSKRNSFASDKWSDKWDDDWDNEDGFGNDADGNWDEPPAKLQTISEDKQPTSEPTSIAPIPTPKTQHQTVTVYQTPVAQKISAILEEFNKVANGAEDQVLLDAVFSLALVSYPDVSESFLFLNDLRAISTKNDYLKDLATSEWSHFCQGLLDDSMEVMSRVDFGNNEEDNEDSEVYIQDIHGIVEKLFAKKLKDTNFIEFRTLLLQLFDLINNQVIDIIVGSEEITEYQSEKITRYLEQLQQIEEDSLSQVHEKPSVLSTTDKIIQAKLLINNRLKSIMDYFYQGELFEFSTDELTAVIKAIFVPSELRENCIREIIDIRSA